MGEVRQEAVVPLQKAAEPQMVAVNMPAAPESAVVSCSRPYIWQKLAQWQESSKWIRVGYYHIGPTRCLVARSGALPAQPQYDIGVPHLLSSRLPYSQRNRRRVFVALGLTTTLAVVAALLGGSSEPTYKDRTMHDWLQQHWNPQQYESLIILGTNNLPLLIKRIGYDEKSDRILAYYRQLPPWLKHEAVTKKLLRRSTNKTVAADEAKAVLEIVGPRAAAAVPQLIRLAREKPREVGERVVIVLDWMGEPGVRPLISLTDHTNQNLAGQAMVLLNGHRNSPLLKSIPAVGYSVEDYASIRAQLKSN